jgi:hypothetical protein
MDKTNRAIKICRRLDEIESMISIANIQKDDIAFEDIFLEQEDLIKEFNELEPSV